VDLARAREEDSPPPKAPPNPPPPASDLLPFEVVRNAYASWLKGVRGTTWVCGPRDYDRVTTATAWAEAEAASRGWDLAHTVAHSLAGFERDKDAAAKGYPLAFWTHDPGRYAAEQDKRVRAERVAERREQRRRDDERAFTASTPAPPPEEVGEAARELVSRLAGKLGGGG